nr:PREDICTED: uncharacterized protein LOC106704635 isoform X2 [Latimeria chalumnae]|eukprot:XP_014347582.1 PREDICTED: uncharacterized protein LOC106704635 isoform X2 [Latimeria chalumnae]
MSNEENLKGTILRCTCGFCTMMPTLVESVCCQEIQPVKSKIRDPMKCITESKRFRVTCIQPDSVETLFYEYLEIEGPNGDEEEIHEVYRYVTYR